MDSDRNVASPDPATKGPLICTHVWTQLTPAQAQCDRCKLTVPTVPEQEV